MSDVETGQPKRRSRRSIKRIKYDELAGGLENDETQAESIDEIEKGFPKSDESDFDVGDDEKPVKLKARRGRPPSFDRRKHAPYEEEPDESMKIDLKKLSQGLG